MRELSGASLIRALTPSMRAPPHDLITSRRHKETLGGGGGASLGLSSSLLGPSTLGTQVKTMVQFGAVI